MLTVFYHSTGAEGGEEKLITGNFAKQCHD